MFRFHSHLKQIIDNIPTIAYLTLPSREHETKALHTNSLEEIENKEQETPNTFIIIPSSLKDWDLT